MASLLVENSGILTYYLYRTGKIGGNFDDKIDPGYRGIFSILGENMLMHGVYGALSGKNPVDLVITNLPHQWRIDTTTLKIEHSSVLYPRLELSFKVVED